MFLLKYLHQWTDKLIERHLFLRILPFDPVLFSAVSDEELMQIYISWPGRKFTRLGLENNMYELEVYGPDSPSSLYENCNINIRNIEKNNDIFQEIQLKPGDKCIIDNKVISVTDLSPFGDCIRVTVDNFSEQQGIRQQDVLPEKLVRTLRQNLREGPFLDGGFLLIDFWGSWCGPCIKTIPDLISIRNEYASKLQMLGIAVEFGKDSTNFQKAVRRHSIDWQQLVEFDGFYSDNSLISGFHIEVFPTLILINGKGQIVFRGSGTESIEFLKNVLRKNLL